MKRLVHAVACCALLATCARGAHAQQGQPQVRVEFSADRKEISMNDNVAVRVFVQTQSSGQPDIEVPEFDGFQVVQRAVQRPMQFSFGFGQAAPVVTSTTQYTFVLVPLGPGTFRIPPVRVTIGQRVYQSQPLVITVSGQGTAQPSAAAHPDVQSQPQQQQQPQSSPSQTPVPQNSGDAAVFDQEAFLRTVIDKTEPYEGEQVTATIYLYTRHNLQQVPAVQTEASTDGMWVQDLLSPTRSLEPTRQVVNGHGFWVYVLRRFAGFPLRSGELTIGSMALTIARDTIFDLFDPSRASSGDLQRSSVPILIHVKPLPPEHKPEGTVAIGNFEIQATLDRKQVVTGDAVTLTVNVRGKGNLRGVKIADPSIKGLQVLQPETHDMIESPNDRVQGTRSFAWLIVPEQPGTYVLPAITLATFDPEHGVYRHISTEKLQLTAAGSARSDALASRDKPPAEERPEPSAREESWPVIRSHSELLRAQTPLASNAFYPWALSFAPLLWLSTLLLPRAWTRIRSRGGESRERTALRGARKRLHEAESALAAHDPRRFHADVASALSTTLEARLGEPISGLTRAELKQKLHERGMNDQLSSALCDVLAQCDFARFSSAAVSDADMQGLLARAEHLWSDVAAFSPAAREGQ